MTLGCGLSGLSALMPVGLVGLTTPNGEAKVNTGWVGELVIRPAVAVLTKLLVPDFGGLRLRMV